MSLSERLQRAEQARSGTETPSPAPPEPVAPSPPESEVGPASALRPSSTLTHAAPVLRAVPDMRTEDAGTEETQCPSCRNAGMLDLVDLVGRVQHFSCPRCLIMWRAPL